MPVQSLGVLLTQKCLGTGERNVTQGRQWTHTGTGTEAHRVRTPKSTLAWNRGPGVLSWGCHQAAGRTWASLVPSQSSHFHMCGIWGCGYALRSPGTSMAPSGQVPVTACSPRRTPPCNVLLHWLKLPLVLLVGMTAIEGTGLPCGPITGLRVRRGQMQTDPPSPPLPKTRSPHPPLSPPY